MKKLASLFLLLLISSSAHADLYSALLWGAGAMTAVAVGGPFGLAAIGYTSTGIAAGSYAATMMSSAALANGGGVAAGSMVATLQAAATAGIGYTVPAAVGVAAGSAKAMYDEITEDEWHDEITEDEWYDEITEDEWYDDATEWIP